LPAFVVVDAALAADPAGNDRRVPASFRVTLNLLASEPRSATKHLKRVISPTRPSAARMSDGIAMQTSKPPSRRP
jgi:hypothetical protein